MVGGTGLAGSLRATVWDQSCKRGKDTNVRDEERKQGKEVEKPRGVVKLTTNRNINKRRVFRQEGDTAPPHNSPDILSWTWLSWAVTREAVATAAAEVTWTAPLAPVRAMTSSNAAVPTVGQTGSIQPIADVVSS